MSDERYKNIGTPMDRAVEECGEFLQALSKAQRFGWFNCHPDRPGTTNIDDVCREMADVVEAFERLEEHIRVLKYENYSRMK